YAHLPERRALHNGAGLLIVHAPAPLPLAQLHLPGSAVHTYRQGVAMHHRIRILPLFAITFLASACVDDSLTAPPVDQAVMMTGSASSAVALTDQERPTKHLFMFKGKAPANFEEQVAALGGTVTLNHHLGIAVVVGLADADAPALGSAVKASYVEEVQPLGLIEPAAVSQSPMALTADPMGAGTGVN